MRIEGRLPAVREASEEGHEVTVGVDGGCAGSASGAMKEMEGLYASNIEGMIARGERVATVLE